MYFTISKVEIRELSSNDYHMISQEFLVSKSLISDKLANIFVAIWENEIIGIVVAYNYNPGCCILSKLYVVPIFQGHGVGRTLLATVEDFCRLNNIIVLRCAIDDDSCDIPKISKLLNQLGWRILGVDYNYYRLRIKNLRMTFLGKHSVEGNGYNTRNVTIKRMSDVSQTEYISLNKYINEVPSSLRPDIISDSIIKELSLYLIKDGNVIGWISTSSKDKEELCIENIYIRYDYRYCGYGITLMGVLMSFLLNDDNQFTFISYYTNNNDSSVKKLYDLLFGKYIEYRINHYNFEKRYDV